MKKFPFLILLIFICFSCEDQLAPMSRPDDLIPRDTMVMCLKEISVIESYIQAKYVHVSRFQKIMKLTGNKILKKYNLTHSRFERSMDYYGSRQDEMSSIYTQILDSLNKDASMLSKDLPKFDSTKLQPAPGVISPMPEGPQ